MTHRHHPNELTLVSYAAGTLGEAASVVVATHLVVCAECRDAVRLGEAIGGVLLEAVVPQPLGSDALDRVLAQLDTANPVTRPDPAQRYGATKASAFGDESTPRVRRSRVIGPLPAPLAPYRADRWRSMAPGIQRIRLIPRRRDRASLDLLRVAPGCAMPDHAHRGLELTCILSGGYSDQFDHFGPGDISEMGVGTEHSPTADKQGHCVCLVASERPLRLTGWVRLLQPLFNI